MPDEPMSFHMIIAGVDSTPLCQLAQALWIVAEANEIHPVGNACIDVVEVVTHIDDAGLFHLH